MNFSLQASMSGKLVRFLVADGSTVQAGANFAEVEVMKMYMPLVAPEAGRVGTPHVDFLRSCPFAHLPINSGVIHFQLQEGSILQPGDLIATVDLLDPSKVQQAEDFTGVLPSDFSRHMSFESSTADLRPPFTPDSLPGPLRQVLLSEDGQDPNVAVGGDEAENIKTGYSTPRTAAYLYNQRPHIIVRESEAILHNLLDGYAPLPHRVKSALAARDKASANPFLPILEVEESLSVLAGRLPFAVEHRLKEELHSYWEGVKRRLEPVTVGTPVNSLIRENSLPDLHSQDSDEDRPDDKGPIPLLTSVCITSSGVSPLELRTGPLLEILRDTESELPSRDLAAFQALIGPLTEILEKYEFGVASAARQGLVKMLEKYLSVEERYNGVGEGASSRREEDVIAELRQSCET